MGGGELFQLCNFHNFNFDLTLYVNCPTFLLVGDHFVHVVISGGTDARNVRRVIETFRQAVKVRVIN